MILLGWSPAAEDQRLAVYSPQTSFTVPVTIHDGGEFVSVTDLLDPFGSVTLTPSGKRCRLKLITPSGSTVEGEFTQNSTQMKLKGKKSTLPTVFWMDNARGYIPLAAAQTILSQLLGLNASMRESSRRLFLGDVGTIYSAELQKGNPPKLVLRFSSPVNPMVSTEPGRVRLTFTRDPVIVNGANPQSFDDAAIHSAGFSENNGTAEIVVATATPLLATFSDNNRTITLVPPPSLAPMPKPPATVGGATTAPGAAPGESMPAASENTVPPPPPRFLVIIDPAHGGDDPGAALGDGWFEKDLTLAIARRIRSDLDQRGIMVALLRDSDANLTLDQRAIMANTSHAAIYVSIHAATLGSGVRLYTARLTAMAGAAKRGFLPWDSAQAAYLAQSQNLASSVIAELELRKIQAAPFQSGLRPLRNLAKPAIAVEIAPAQGAVETLTSAQYQQSIATAIASAIANVRSGMEGTR